MQKVAYLQAKGEELRAIRVHCGEVQTFWMTEGGELCKGYGRAFFAEQMTKVLKRMCMILLLFFDHIPARKVEVSAIDFFIFPFLSPRILWTL